MKENIDNKLYNDMEENKIIMSTMTIEGKNIEVNCIVTGKLKVNTFFIKSGENVVVIDPGGDPELIISEIEDFKNILIILTHCHYDHSGATNEILSAIPRAKFAAHSECIRLAGNTTDNLSQFLMNIDYKITHNPSFTLDDNEVFNCGNIKLKALHSTGHSLGHLCYWIQSERILFCGDLLTAEDIGRHDVPGSNLSEMIEDCKDLLTQIPSDTIIFPGHGNPITAQEVKETNPHLKKFYR